MFAGNAKVRASHTPGIGARTSCRLDAVFPDAVPPYFKNSTMPGKEEVFKPGIK